MVIRALLLPTRGFLTDLHSKLSEPFGNAVTLNEKACCACTAYFNHGDMYVPVIQYLYSQKFKYKRAITNETFFDFIIKAPPPMWNFILFLSNHYHLIIRIMRKKNHFEQQRSHVPQLLWILLWFYDKHQLSKKTSITKMKVISKQRNSIKFHVMWPDYWV